MKKNNEVLVKVQNVSKKFSLDLKTSLKYGALDILKSTFGFKISKELRPKEFWAIRDVSFELRRGECIGLIGHNGAGKSTLLKMLNGLYTPDKGQITMKGKIGALIELGAGFNPILTGRENIYNNAAILGFSKNDVDNKIESIIDFSEIAQFIDSPVQNYSSGMKVRLGFAIAAHLEPDILIIDEVLAVGDLGFVLKCFSKIDELLPNTAMIFVSHSMPMISRICNEIILMDHGIAEYQGNDIGKGVQIYYSKFSNNDEAEVFNNGDFTLTSKSTDLKNNILRNNSDFTLKVEFKINTSKNVNAPLLYIEFKDKEQRSIAGLYVRDEKAFILNCQTILYTARVKNPLFTLGKYTIDIGLYSLYEETPIFRQNSAFEFVVDKEKERWISIELESESAITIN
ncbi:ABC transporter [Chryseobacterium sp. JAH]|nr:ABC transporter [Chryseobacterium sp. JAH]